MITTLVFDLGGVILTDDDSPVMTREFQRLFNLTKKQIVEGWTRSWDQYKIGKLSEDNFWRLLLHAINPSIKDIENAKKFYRDYAKADESIIALLNTLKHNYKLIGLSILDMSGIYINKTDLV